MLKFIVFCCSFFSLASFVCGQTPIAQFSANKTSTCVGAPVVFSDMSSYFNKNVISTTWDFGEGGRSTNANPTYTYSAPGTYRVLLTVISSDGTDFELKSNYITVNPNPTADFTTAGNGCTVPFAVTFANTSSQGVGINYSWNFGNGQTSSLSSPSAITYNTIGTYPVSLTVTNSVTSCTSSITKNLVVSDYTAGITSPAIGCLGQTVSISDASTVGVNTWLWNSGDGQTSTSQNPSFIYSTPGTYTISLTSQNSVSGCSDVESKTINIQPAATASFTTNLSGGCAPLTINFTNTSGSGTFNWDFGNGSTSLLKNPPSKTYTVDGTYTVSLTMKDVNGCENSVTTTIEVGPPTVDFVADKINGCSPLSIQFSDLSISSNPTADPIVSWLWNFGDGSTYSGQNPPPHVYTSGKFSVSLKIVTQSGCTKTLLKNDYIEVGLIDNIDFSVLPIIECTRRIVSFTDLSTISTPHAPDEVSYNWDFGDRGISTLQNPKYNYPVDTGYFDIQLVVDFRGCSDTLIREKQVYIKAPISKFIVPPLYCNPTSFPVQVSIEDEAIAGANTDNVDMIWRWNDGTSDSFLNGSSVLDADKGNISHNYTTYGRYVIKQVIHNYTTGCDDSTEQIIHITKMDAGFLLSNDSVCSTLPISMTSNSIFLHPDATFTYDMGNGDFVSGEPASYIYNTPGVYTIKLLATNSVGCVDSSKFVGLKVLDLPKAQFTPSALGGCLPITVNYTNTSTAQGNGVPLKSFLWTFPDGTTQTTNSLTASTHFAFSSEGSFITSLVATDNFGCVSNPEFQPMLITNPTVDFALDNVVCDLENFTTVNSTTGYGPLAFKWSLDNALVSNNIDYSHFFDEHVSNSYTNVAHTIKLVAIDGNGCKDSITKTIRVSLPMAKIMHVASGATANAMGEYTCPPVFETFTDKSTSYGNLTTWNWNFGDGVTSNFQSPNNTYVFPGTYTVSLHVMDEFGCTADTALVDYLTILGPGGNLNWTAVGEACEHKYHFSASNLTYVDSIIWHHGDGDTTFNLQNFDYIYSVGNYNPIGSLIDALGCKIIFPLQPIDVQNITISANAGPDQSVCSSEVTMAASIDQNGTGTWTIVSGNGNIADIHDENTIITGLGIGENIFKWTIQNACGLIADEVKITRIDNATTSNAGADIFTCSNSVNLTGNTPSAGNGIWTKFSGAGTISSTNDPISNVTGLSVGINEFIWSISNTCSTSRDTVKIIVETAPTVPTAGADQQACIPTATLDGNTPLSGIGKWTLFSGFGIITSPNLANSGVTNLPLGINKFVWTIANSCGTNSDTVIIIGVNSPTKSNAGVDQQTCLTTTSLHGNKPIVGIGSWSLVSGSGNITNTADSLTTVSGLGIGPNVFEWSINSFCGNDEDQVTITVETPPTIADAGPDNVFCGNSVNLEGNNALVGNGVWSIISGSGNISNTHSANTLVNNLGVGPTIFKWEIANSCASSFDLVTITSEITTTIANAGKDSTFCSSTIKLKANKAISGKGYWTVESGTGILSNPNDSLATVSGMSIGENKFRWTISNLCNSNFDEVVYTIEGIPTLPNAGPDQSKVCETFTNLAANTPLIGVGQWKLISGTATIVSPSSPTTNITGLGLGETVFQWTISNTCGTQSDRVSVFRYEKPTVATSTPIAPICGTNSILTGNKVEIGTGVWTLVSGLGNITQITNPTSTVTNLGKGENIFKWSIFNGCGITESNVTIMVESDPTKAKVGPDQVVCGNYASLDGIKPMIGKGTWTLVSGSGTIHNVADSSSGVDNLGFGENIFKWTISNSCSSSTAQIIIANTGDCPDEDSIKNELIYFIPNTFTPNSDPYNQTFLPVFYSGYEPLKYTLYIFNRWGEIIFESHDADIGWKGTYGENGPIVQDDVYTWKIIFTEINTQKVYKKSGHVVLIR